MYFSAPHCRYWIVHSCAISPCLPLSCFVVEVNFYYLFFFWDSLLSNHSLFWWSILVVVTNNYWFQIRRGLSNSKVQYTPTHEWLSQVGQTPRPCILWDLFAGFTSSLLSLHIACKKCCTKANSTQNWSLVRSNGSMLFV